MNEWHILKFAHGVVTLLLLAGTITLMATTLGAPSEKMALHLTSTFLSTYTTDTPATTWSPPLDPLTPTQIADTYYTCLHSATVGFAAPLGCVFDDVASYRLCLDAKTSSQEYRSQLIALGIKDIVAKLQGDTLGLSLTAYNSITTALASPQALLSASASYLDQDTEYTRSLYGILARASNVRGVGGCLSQVDQTPSASRAVVSVYSDLWDCTAELLHTDVAQADAFQQCVPLSSWPALDVMQTPYSTVLLGSYNKAFALLVGMWLLTSFAVYTAWLGVESHPTAGGKPGALFARCGMVLTVFCVLWNGLGGVVMVMVKAFGSPANAGGFPMTVQTVFVTGVAVLLGTGYFLRELWEQAGIEGDAPDPSHAGYSRVLPTPGEGKNSRASFMHARLAGFVRVGQATDKDLRDMQYAPLLAPAWSDGWLLCDGLFLMGIIGTSNDVVSGDLVRCFLLVLYAAAAHSAFIRLFYESYVNEVPGDDPAYTQVYTANKSRDERGRKTSREGLHIMTLLVNLTVLLFALPFWSLVFLRYAGSVLICSYVALVSVLPAVAWLVYTICVDFDLFPASLAAVSQVGFLYSASVRAIFVFVVAVGATADFDANTRLASMLALMER